MAQAGPDVLAVVVVLLLVEGHLGVQALECGPQLAQLCLPPLPLPTLVADVLGSGDQGRGELAPLTGEPQALSKPAHARGASSGKAGRGRFHSCFSWEEDKLKDSISNPQGTVSGPGLH